MIVDWYTFCFAVFVLFVLLVFIVVLPRGLHGVLPFAKSAQIQSKFPIYSVERGIEATIPRDLETLKPPSKYLPVERLAALLGVTARTIRSYCESGLIPEAKRKRNSNRWQIPHKLSARTRWSLMKESGKLRRDLERLKFTAKVGELRGEGLTEEFYELLILSERSPEGSLEAALKAANKDISAVEQSDNDDELQEDETHLLDMVRSWIAKNVAFNGSNHEAIQKLHVAALITLRECRNVRVEWIAEAMEIHKSTLYRRYGGAKELKQLLSPFRNQRPQ